MAPVKSSTWGSINELLENDDKVFLDVSELLVKFANNVLNNPDNDKYRQIRVANPVVMARLLPVAGAMQCLFDMGFQEHGEFFKLPRSVLLDNMSMVRDELNRLRQQFASPPPPQAQQAPPVQQTPAVSSTPTSPNLLQKEVQFYQKLETSAQLVMMYEDVSLQQKAQACIPVTTLEERAKRRSQEGCNTADLLLLELLAWFKTEFFVWVDAPKCQRCQSNSHAVGMVEPTPAELLWGASRVENYKCGVCGTHTRFPRYNHPGKLLETRSGRCGEWANCFTLCCRALNYDARYVMDWTDHVWTEVYSDSQRRWLHCDSCENACDRPLMYETGWGKHLSYVIAFSRDDIQDVTWRYSSQHDAVLSRRSDCRESALLNMVLRMRRKRQETISDQRREQLLQRLVVEMVEFLTTREAKDGEGEGRSTGSLAWRQARGEVGTQHKSSVITLNDAETKSKCFHLKYCCAKDAYIRVSNGNSEVAKWSGLVAEVENMTRKEETDWSMVYLARTEGSDTAHITWKWDFSDSGLEVDHIRLKLEWKTYESGQIHWQLCTGDACSSVTSNGEWVEVDTLRGARAFSLTATLQGGKGDIAWQHTQLFRQGLHDNAQFPMEVCITLRDQQ